MAIYQNQIIQMKITDFDLMKSVIVIEELATKLSSLTTVYSFLQKYDRQQESDSKNMPSKLFIVSYEILQSIIIKVS